MSNSPTWYDLLGVSPTASGDEIRAVWKAAIADLEPTDRRFQMLNRAAEVLLDPPRRAAYDAELAEESEGSEEPDLGFEAQAPGRLRTSTSGSEPGGLRASTSGSEPGGLRASTSGPEPGGLRTSTSGPAPGRPRASTSGPEPSSTSGSASVPPAKPVLTPRELSRERTRIEREVSKDLARQRRREEKSAETDLGFEAQAPGRLRTSTSGPGPGRLRTSTSGSEPGRLRTSTSGPGPGGLRTSTSVPGWLLAALAAAVLIVGGAAATVFFVVGHGDDEDSSAAAQTAAEQAIVPILSYDYRHLDQDRAAAQSYLTADYKLEYDKTFTLIQQNAEAVRPVVVAKLVSSGLERSGADRVKVVLFVDQETTNKETAEPVVYQNYVTVTMQQVDGEWLVDQLDTQG